MSGARRRQQFDGDDEVQMKKRRGAPLQNDVDRKLQEVIGRVGDKNSGSSIEANLDQLTKVLHDDLDNYRATIIDIVTGCAIYLPNRVTVYTTLVGLLNAKNFNFGGDVVEKLIAEQQDLLEKQKYQEAQNLAIFLCDLGNCNVLTLQSIGEYLESFVAAAYEDNMPQVRTDFYIQTVLRCLPWIGKELTEKATEQMENITQAIGKYLEQRNKSHVQLLQVWHNSDLEQMDYLESLSAQVEVLRQANWQEPHIPRHYVGFETTLQDALQHNLPSFSAPAHNDEMIYPYPLVVFRLFDNSDCTNEQQPLPVGNSIERLLFEGEIAWIIEKNQFSRKACARELLIFADENPSIPVAYLIFETIFGQMLRLPHAPYPALFHCSLLLELLRLKPDEYPQILVQTVELLYRRIDSMQPICVDRLVDWFSFHLSNFQYRYTWGEWKDCLEKDTFSGSQIFVREVLEKCRRLGSYEKLKAAVPDSFTKIFPCDPEIRYNLDDESPETQQKAETFTGMFQERQPADAFVAELKTNDPDDVEYNVHDFGIFVAVMLKMAAKTYSHNFSALSRYQGTLKTVCDTSDRCQEKLLDTIYSCWKTNQQMMMILIDKLLKMQVLDCCVVVCWLFDERMWHEHDRQWLFEVLNQALEKLTRQIILVEKDVHELTDKLDGKVEENEGEEQMEDEETKEKRREADLEQLESKKKKLESMVHFQKALFSDFFLAFLDELKVASDSKTSEMDGSGDQHTPKFQWLRGRFCHVLLAHAETLLKHSTALAREVFNGDDIDQSVIDCFNQFQSLRI